MSSTPDGVTDPQSPPPTSSPNERLVTTAQPGSRQTTEVPTRTSAATTAITTTTSPPPQPGARPEPLTGISSTMANPNSKIPIPPPPKAGDIPQQQHQQQIPTTTISGYPSDNTYSSGPIPRNPYTYNNNNNNNCGYTYSNDYNYNYNNPTSAYTSIYQAPNPEIRGINTNRNVRVHGSTTMLDSDGFGGEVGSDSTGAAILESAKSWFSSAGSKLAEVEAAVWKRINDAHEK
ncbi:hypothetical protein EYZ11_001912 [Aspergillus tanneri]|uniref:Uncharacterized protein n=1 Tax=Aspergillus tanneri TaxID=1220188 RepID=A0A4V3UQD0_9EURO|nr:uncharacterized protein ATNIH1004_008874 [Aspergillus tanneri]KAA8644668.1 hypothetical protein ATNIH1004_008874 [Aspergillus tanneri]THC98634.1 hypothetical protein EYZ11_001912 [Aspergillus tanneri]